MFNAWDISVLLNSVSDGDANATNDPAKLNWANFTVSDGTLPDFNPALTAGVDLSISGAAELNVLSGLVVLKGTQITDIPLADAIAKTRTVGEDLLAVMRGLQPVK